MLCKHICLCLFETASFLLSQKVGLPQTLVTEGSLTVNTCNVSLTVNLQCDRKTAYAQVESSYGQKYTLGGMLRHSVDWLGDLGLPAENSAQLSVAKSSMTEGILSLQIGECKFKARGDLQTQNKTEWTLETETDCQHLQVSLWLLKKSIWNRRGGVLLEYSVDGCCTNFSKSVYKHTSVFKYRISMRHWSLMLLVVPYRWS